ncbi:YfhD family protein [Halobacillus kuroshimensis]|uniref:YfhD family protein n=2 Tax=Halobacillus TaxID=45667 RepID=A0A845DTW9_9BACI|nr:MULTISPECIES: YfhD family protein [Halobacillus]MBN8235469.1 YfhD family protein [Halobacillus kuroshimensis]MCA1024049.1 YfhD family protein [Halobacillus litoralis]MYL21083.1 YfhD family protein [Halobacillus litoralis]MYL31381.1 YfhD family protein [Halobacillus halophilus]MYL38464.1 YfhD family protein [Halobacillus litoralis]
MGRDEHHKGKGKQKRKLPQTPKSQKHANIDVEFSEELADREDKIAQERAKAADRRAHKRM